MLVALAIVAAVLTGFVLGVMATAGLIDSAPAPYERASAAPSPSSLGSDGIRSGSGTPLDSSRERTDSAPDS